MTALRALALLALAGAPGCELAPPTIESTTDLGATTDTVGPYRVESIIRDVMDGDRIELFYAVATGARFIPRPMSGDGERFAGAIPGQPVGTTVRYFVAVRRDGDEVARDPADPAATFELAVVAPPGEP